MFKYYYGLLFDLAFDLSCCKPSNRRLAAGAVNCYKRSATLGTCCSQLSSVVSRHQSRTEGGSASYRSAILLFSEGMRMG